MVTGTWDDHDYGSNNLDKKYPFKDQSKKYFLEFIDDGSDRTSHQGIYHSFLFGTDPKKSLKLILIDNRSFRDS